MPSEETDWGAGGTGKQNRWFRRTDFLCLQPNGGRAATEGGEEPPRPLTGKEVPGSQSGVKGINRIRQENRRPHKFKIGCSR